MLFYSTIKFYRSTQKKIAGLVLLTLLATTATAQNIPRKTDSLFLLPANSLYAAASKKPAGFMTLRLNHPAHQQYVFKTQGELMHWPNYPLTAAQIIARQEQWQRRNNQSFGQKVAGDIANEIVRTQVNALIYGKKMPVAVVPKF